MLFKQALDLIKCKKHLTLEGLQEIVNIKASPLRSWCPPAKQLRFPLPSLVFFLFVYKVFCIQKVKREYLHMEIGEGEGWY